MEMLDFTDAGIAATLTLSAADIQSMTDSNHTLHLDITGDDLIELTDPLANIAILQDQKRLLAIMKDGVFHKEPDVGAARGRFSRSVA
jgi:hypothetical protein